MPRITELQREVAQLRGLTQSGELRPVFHLHSSTGEPLRHVTMDGQAVRSGPGPNDVTFTLTEDMYNDLAGGDRYVVLYGGRGSGKSHSVARWLLAAAMVKPLKVLCSRETQVSIKESSKYLLEEVIKSDPKLDDFYDYSRDWITGRNGSYFIFKGMHETHADALRSLEGVDLLWIEEAQSISARSWETADPTIRRKDSRIFMTLNPTRPTDVIYEEFIAAEEPNPWARVAKYNMSSNPWADDALRQRADRMRLHDFDRWSHVFNGNLRTFSDLQIFQNWSIDPQLDIEQIIADRIAAIKVGFNGTIEERRKRRERAEYRIRSSFFIGSDHGWRDPFALLLVYLWPEERLLFILDEFVQQALDVPRIAKAMEVFLEKNRISRRWPIMFENARPEVIAPLNDRYNLNVKPCKKLRIEDRIDMLKDWTIIVADGLPNIHRELQSYSWKTDRQGTVLPIPEDRHNHLIDSLFYAIGDAVVLDRQGGYKPLTVTYS